MQCVFRAAKIQLFPVTVTNILPNKIIFVLLQIEMTEKEILELQNKLDEGLRLAEKRMLEEKALHGEDIIVCNDDGIIQRIPAKKALEALAV